MDREYRYIPISLAVIFLAFVFFSFLNAKQLFSPCPGSGDIALTALQVEAAKELNAFTGPYCRYGFQHPGPAQFYLYALGHKLLFFLEEGRARTLTAQLILNIALYLIAFLLVGYKQAVLEQWKFRIHGVTNNRNHFPRIPKIVWSSGFPLQ